MLQYNFSSYFIHLFHPISFVKILVFFYIKKLIVLYLVLYVSPLFSD